MLFVVSGMLRTRQLAKADGSTAKPLPQGKAPKSEPALASDDDMAEIEALLRKRGIT